MTSSESIVEINGHLYRYHYDESSGKTLYDGPVGEAPTLSEEEFLVSVRTKQLHTYEEVMKNRRLLKGVKAPWRKKWQKVELTDTLARFRVHGPSKMATFFVLDGKELSQLGFKKGDTFKEQPKDLRREIHQFGIPLKEKEWVIKDLSRQPDPKQSYYVIATFEGRVPKERAIQSVVRRLQ